MYIIIQCRVSRDILVMCVKRKRKAFSVQQVSDVSLILQCFSANDNLEKRKRHSNIIHSEKLWKAKNKQWYVWNDKENSKWKCVMKSMINEKENGEKLSQQLFFSVMKMIVIMYVGGMKALWRRNRYSRSWWCVWKWWWQWRGIVW